MSRFRLPLLTLTLLPFLLTPTAYGQGSKKTWPVQTKGQDGLREPQERATLPVPTSGFSKPLAKPVERGAPSLARRASKSS